MTVRSIRSGSYYVFRDDRIAFETGEHDVDLGASHIRMIPYPKQTVALDRTCHGRFVKVNEVNNRKILNNTLSACRYVYCSEARHVAAHPGVNYLNSSIGHYLEEAGALEIVRDDVDSSENPGLAQNSYPDTIGAVIADCAVLYCRIARRAVVHASASHGCGIVGNNAIIKSRITIVAAV